MAPLPSLRPPDQTADPYVLIACSCEMPPPDIGRLRSDRETSGPPPAEFNFQTANASPPLLFATQGASVSLFRFPKKGNGAPGSARGLRDPFRRALRSARLRAVRRRAPRCGGAAPPGAPPQRPLSRTPHRPAWRLRHSGPLKLSVILRHSR